MIQNLVSATTFLAALASALAAYFWYHAAMVDPPPTVLTGSSRWASRANPDAPNAVVDATPLIKFAKESGRRNKVAALWSAAAASFAFLGWALGAYASLAAR